VLTSSGQVDTFNLRKARATDEYVLRGSAGDEFFEPRFTYHGFRYVEVTGHPGTPAIGDMVARVVHTAAPTSAKFSCSSDLVNRIAASIFRSQQGNFFSVPTDCPQRDERLGWMGDAKAFWRTACYQMDLAGFSAKWTRDIREAQRANGAFQDISPEIPGLVREGSPFWSDAGVTVPWTAWRHYGDTRIIAENYAAMQKWLSYILARNPNHIWEKDVGQSYGDWLAPSGNPASDHPVIATAVWAENAKMMADMARAIGRPVDAASYEALFGKIKTAFNQRFVSTSGKVGSGHQTPQALALRLGLLPTTQVKGAVDTLAQDVQNRGWHLSTGFVGTSCLLPALSEGGRDDAAYQVLLQTTHPSWGYMVKQGGTTMWERWDSDVVCRTRSSHLCSFNHFCFGGVGEWLFRYLGGIDLDGTGVGFDRIVVRPRLAPGITWAEARYESVRGTIRSRWENAGGNFSLELTIPTNTRAKVHLPAPGPGHVRESGRPVTPGTGVIYLGQDSGRTVFEVGGGTYAFRVGGVTTTGQPRIGQLNAVRLFQPARGGMPYQLAASRTYLTGIPVPGVGTIPLDLDPLLMMSISGVLPTVFINFRGRLDAYGEAFGIVALPPMPVLVGIDFRLAGVTFDGKGINYISNGLRLVIGK
jgi:alpha-L-rhamnosidase